MKTTIGKVESHLRGFDRMNSNSLPDTSFDEATRTFTVSVKAGQPNFSFWSNGNFYEKTTTQTVTWADVSGKYYFYFDEDGVLQSIENSALTEAIFTTVAICGYCTWNAVTQKAIIQAKDELHGIYLPAISHLMKHLDTGMVWYQGGDISGLADNNDDYTGIATIVMGDEDITLVTAATSTHPFIYRSGANGEYVETAPDNLVGFKNGGANVVWNEYSGGEWKLTQSTFLTDYMIYIFIMTNDRTYPIKKVIATDVYATRDAARLTLYDRLRILKQENIISAENKFLFAYIVRDNGDIENGANGEVYVDLRGNIDKSL